MKILITGGCGFIGSNLAAKFAENNQLYIFDSLSREGSEKNYQWLKTNYSDSITFDKKDITDYRSLKKVVDIVDVVIHLAAQVAVTSSVSNPRRDFEVNALGTFNVLEAVRQSKNKPLVIYSSTNKVYGDLIGARYKETDKRFVDSAHPDGVDEDQSLDFYSPYACSKGCGDSYVRDYARIYNLSTVIFRQSCIYGIRQFGSEDQGWVAHFVRRVLNNQPLVIYGTGKQVRDLLYINDLLNLFEKVIFKRKKLFKYEYKNSLVLNIGGGKGNAVSLLDIIEKLEKILDREIKLKFKAERPGDQKVYVSNIKKAQKLLDWKPMINIDQGLVRLVNWIKNS